MFVLLLFTAPLSGKEARFPSLKDTFKNNFHIGSAVDREQLKKKRLPIQNFIASQFNSISSESLLKWAKFNPKPNIYNYADADAFVEFGQKNNMYIVGHVLFWHMQTPAWGFKNKNGQPLSREELLARMRERVSHISKRYGKKIHAWDVVNEAFTEDGKLRDSQWSQIIGNDFIEQAFRIADEELPINVKLLYNDYSMSGKAKRDAVIKMVDELHKKKVRIDGVGMQGHWALKKPSIKEIEKSIVAFSKAGVDVHISELDIDVLPRKLSMWRINTAKRLKENEIMDPYRNGLPKEIQQRLAKRYSDIFRLLIKHQENIMRVTFWGATDKYSWLNNWPIKGRVNYPLLFNRASKPKAAFHAVVTLKTQ